jgi:3',5'-cyclic AMP phosphodiesterase CpdA
MYKNLMLLCLCLLLISINAGCKSNDSYADSLSDEQTDIAVEQTGLPVDETALAPMEIEHFYYTPAITNDVLHNITTGDKNGLNIDLNDPDIWGKIHTGPYPFEAGDSDYDFPYFRKTSDIVNGQGSLNIESFFSSSEFNSNNWLSGGRSTATTTIAYRLELFSGTTIKGMAGSFVSFQKNGDIFEKLPTIVEGPFVTELYSDNPTTLNIVWRTDELCTGQVKFGEYVFDDGSNVPKTLHSVPIDNLVPDAEYVYNVTSEAQDGRTVVSNTYKVRTAPPKGQGDIKFVYTSDSYDTSGGGERNYLGCNMDVLRDVTANAFRDGAEYMIFGGDLIKGMTVNKEDMIVQYRAWKQIVSGFWHTRPIYPGMGNHEFLYNLFDGYIAMDKWPYDTDSSEVVFAQEFYNPKNGPETSDPRRPSYEENVYHFQHGPVLNISVNTTYWVSMKFGDYSESPQFGGAPFGYIMEDQLSWIEETLETAEDDNSIKFIFIFTHCPILPYMTHVEDSMWWNGNNNIKAQTRKLNTETQEYEIQPESLGIIDVRDRLLTAVTKSTKVAAIFTSHEHGYHRTLISKYTPVYTDGSTNPNFNNATWHIMCGGGGSGFNGESLDPTPWKPQRITSHTGYVMLETKGDKVGMKFIGGLAREVLDDLDDLMAIKYAK